MSNSHSGFMSALFGISRRVVVLAFLAFAVSACGGGGGSTANNPPTTTPPPGGGSPNNPPPPPDPVDDEQSSAESARMVMTLGTSQLSINWIDRFDNELGYKVERRVGDGSWEVVEALPALDGERGEWTRFGPATGRYRVTVTLQGRSLPLHSSGGETEIEINTDPARPLPTIAIDQAEPIRGPVQVSMENVGASLGVYYLLDTAVLAHVTSGATFAYTLPAQQLVDGTHTVVALVEKSPGLMLIAARQVQVDNPAPAVLLALNSPQTADDPLVMRAMASSDAGIGSVEFFVNGNSVQVVSTPEIQGPYRGQYLYSLDPTALPPGPNVFRVVATDSTTATAAMEEIATIDLVPKLNVTGLFDGMIASGRSVNITGEFGDDTAGATLTITASDLRVLRTQTSPFAVIFSLDGVPPGEHSVSIRVQDRYGKVNSRYYRVIVPSTPLNYELLDTDVELLLAADQGSLLYKKRSGAVMRKNSTGVATALPPAAAGFMGYRWVAGRIVAFSQDRHMYALDHSGQPTELAPLAPFHADAAPTFRGPWVSWLPANDSTVFKLYNVSTGNLRDVPVGGTAAASPPEIVLTPGNERLLFRATMNGTAGIYSHNLATTATQLIASGPLILPRSDGTRIAWFDMSSAAALVVAPLNNPAAATVLAPDAMMGVLEDGLVCWLDRDDYELHVNDGSVTTQLATPQWQLLSESTVNDGRVIFVEDNQMHVWNPANGERVWLDTVAPAIQADGVAYFLTGSGHALYRVTLP